MSPFATDDAFANIRHWGAQLVDDPFRVTVNGFDGTLVSSATAALDIVLTQLSLKSDDEVWIETTSNNKYISGCVTRTIEKHCKWSRRQGPKTAAVLVNHEFGHVYPKVGQLKKLGYPIIEDAAYSMFSGSDEGLVGSVGDYAVYSLAKMFPMQCGGILVDKSGTLASDVQADFASFLKCNYRFYIPQRANIVDTRVQNHCLLADKLAKFGFKPRFEANQHEVPGAFVFTAHGFDLEGMKRFLLAQGIECTVFYGEEAFVLPCHQSLGNEYFDCFVSLINYFQNASRPRTNGR